MDNKTDDKTLTALNTGAPLNDETLDDALASAIPTYGEGPADDITAAEQLAFLAQDVRKRASRYLFLARALSDERVTFGLIDGLRDIPPHTGTDLDVFAASLRADSDPQTDANVSNACLAVRADHQAHFAPDVIGIGHGSICLRESQCLTYSDNSAYVDAQDVIDSITEQYDQWEFDRTKSRYTPEVNMPVDHICAELSFLAYLGLRASDSLQKVICGEVEENSDAGLEALSDAEIHLNAQFGFIADHSIYWIPQLCDQIETKTTTDFYHGVAQMLRNMIRNDEDYLDAFDPTGD